MKRKDKRRKFGVSGRQKEQVRKKWVNTTDFPFIHEFFKVWLVIQANVTV